ncbi:MAG TPA: sigma-70 family RNA polymerase sigma factor [Nitrospiria bacterium]|nr:sigma-70 family RNA polymerase sigma factor [Nitrospiria bacterium]
MGQPFDLTQIFENTRKELLAFVSRLVGADEAEDILQDAWLNLYQRGRPDTWRQPRAFLFAAVRNLSLDRLRHRRRWERMVDPEQEPEEPVCPQPGPDTVVNGKQRLKRITDALEELPPVCRDAFLLNRLCEHTHAEIANRLGVSTKTVQRHIERALTHCLNRLHRADAGEPDRSFAPMSSQGVPSRRMIERPVSTESDADDSP